MLYTASELAKCVMHKNAFLIEEQIYQMKQVFVGK